MHKFIYPSKDTYINNSSKLDDRNFGIDEILEIYASNRGKKVVYTDPNWHPVPATSSSYGNEGWLAYSTSSLHIYSGSQWRSFSLTRDAISGSSFIANFTGRISNDTGSRVLYISGSSEYASGSFSGSFKMTTTSRISGSFAGTGSFSGSISSGSTFTYLNVNDSLKTSPLTSSVTGTGSFIGLSGIIHGKSNTGIPCSSSYYLPVRAIDSGSFNGTFSSSTATDWYGLIDTSSSADVYYADVTNFKGYIKGMFSGSITRPTAAEFVLHPEYTRTMLQFDLVSISQSISSNEVSSSNMKFYLDLTSCGARNLPLDYTLYAYPISQSWENGDGRFANDGSTVGASWDYKNESADQTWHGPVTESTRKVDYLLTASYGSASWDTGGGTWHYDTPSTYTDSTHWICSSSAFPSLTSNTLIASQSFSYGAQSDVSMDITQIVRAWLCGCVPNEGLMLISSFELLTPAVNHTNGLLQFFSRDTNTIYSPRIDVRYDDSVYNTGSLAPVSGSTESLINIQYLKGTYKGGSIPKIYVFSRDKYPLKTFSKSLQQNALVTPKYLPTSSYYMIKDAESEEVLVDFDDYSKLSCDATNGNYFKIDTTNFPQERYYKILIKVDYSDGTVDIQDTEKIFKIVR
jgi:hypothetical protein